MGRFVQFLIVLGLLSVFVVFLIPRAGNDRYVRQIVTAQQVVERFVGRFDRLPGPDEVQVEGCTWNGSILYCAPDSFSASIQEGRVRWYAPSYR